MSRDAADEELGFSVSLALAERCRVRSRSAEKPLEVADRAGCSAMGPRGDGAVALESLWRGVVVAEEELALGEGLERPMGSDAALGVDLTLSRARRSASATAAACALSAGAGRQRAASGFGRTGIDSAAAAPRGARFI